MRTFFFAHLCFACPIERIEINNIQKMTLSIKDFFSKCDQIRSFLKIWLHLLKTSLIEHFMFCAVEFIQACMTILLHRRNQTLFPNMD